jgi:hypothetical protein
MEVDNPLVSATLTIHSSEPLRSGNAMVVAVDEAVDVEVIKVEAWSTIFKLWPYCLQRNR